MFVWSNPLPHLRQLLLLLMVGVVSSCVQNSSGGRNYWAQQNAITPTPTPTPIPPANTTDLYWYTTSKVVGILTINATDENHYYLRGPIPHYDLSDAEKFARSYCLIIKFPPGLSGVKKQLRARAIPITNNNFSGTTEFLYRLDFFTKEENQYACSGNFSSYSQVRKITELVGTADSAFSPLEVCPTCANYITAEEVGMVSFSANTRLDEQSDLNFINYEVLSLRLDPISRSTTANNTCTNAQCQINGFDCCMDNQCVREGAERIGAASSPDYLAALASVAQNANNFTLWPQVFYVCDQPNVGPIPPLPTAIADPQGTAEQQRQLFLRDYVCVNQNKYIFDPPINNDFTNGVHWHCENDRDYQVVDTQDETAAAYQWVKNDVWKRCGCQADWNITNTSDPDHPQNACPDYSLKLVDPTNQKNLTAEQAQQWIGDFVCVERFRSSGDYSRCIDWDDSNGGVADSFDYRASLARLDMNVLVACLVPSPIPLPTPFQNLSLTVDSRSVPHRFFRADNHNPVNDLTLLAGEDVLPEGDRFLYEDQEAKLSPMCVDSSGVQTHTPCINSILGQMSVDLDQALPAKTVDVVFEETYVITSYQGNYTPCPECLKDFWYAGFSAYPASSSPNGIESTGFTTARDVFSQNYSNANYEDLIFGRACWVPPTMLPYSHWNYPATSDQRINRLQTQATYYANGYQRDWFGFNKGALIGSFDGVKWFAIGKGRQVTATSSKLFLAINAPFGDLAAASSYHVQIVADLGPNTIATTDFDPARALSDPYQNLGASCQRWHQCEVDADCVSKLGWEYLCADTTPFLTYGPHFNLEAEESPNRKVEQRVVDFLQNAITEGSTKRCVYRGSGAPCRTNLSELIDGTTNQHYLMLRHMSCAPNFYCASVELSEDFNTQVVRTVNEFDYFSPNFNRAQSFEFGQEAQVLGRPLHYVNGQLTGGLPANVRANIIGNLERFNTQLLASSFNSNEAGICRPGKALGSDNPAVNHRNPDSVLWRTDYISQIGGCNSSTTQADRYLACPNFNLSSSTDSEKDNIGNYLFLNASYSETQKYSLAMQNSCGGEALSLGGLSPFQYIEADPIGSASFVRLDHPALAKDGCLRRAGSYCHTDLDCSPNGLHAGQVEHFDLSYFGGTLAEKEYWQESLVCGQGLRQPYSTEAAFQTFDMTRNRCCRPVGEKFTMYTAVDSVGLAPDYDASNIGPSGNPRPNTKVLSYLSPNSDYRYSRYSNIQLYSSWDASYSAPVAPTLIGTAATAPSTSTPYAEAPAVLAGQIPHKFQWKAFQDSGRNLCCGSGFVRLFSDGTNNWKKEDRLRFNTKNFQCLNYHTNLYDLWSIFSTSDLTANYQRFHQVESELLCVNARKNGCIQVPFLNQEDFALVPPSPVDYNQGLGNTPQTYGKEDYRRRMIYNTTAGFFNEPGTVILDTTPWGVDGDAHNSGEYEDAFVNAYQLVNHLFPYQPLAVSNSHIGTGSDPVNFFPINNGGSYPMISFTLPIYILATKDNQSNIRRMSIVYYTSYVDETSAASEVFLIPQGACPSAEPIPPPVAGANMGVNTWCINSNNVVYVIPDLTATVGGNPWKIAGVRIYFTPLNNLGPTQHTYGATVDPINDPRAQAGMYPGNPLYLLTKLERFELLGIPQIFYEPIVCNSSRGQLVPGLFKTDSMATFESAGVGIDYPGQGNVASELPTIFQSNYPTGDAEYYPTTDNPNSKVVLQDQVSDNLTPVFSAHEFLCCQKLGAQVTNPSQCCSGEGTLSSSSSGNIYYCSLPQGTSLNVYFNRFVSGEGYVGDYDQCIKDAGLEETDFIPETGSPKLAKDVYDKLIFLGAMFCNSSNKKFSNGCPQIDYTSVRLGTAFGYFYPEPFQGWEYGLMPDEPIVRDPTYLSIIDSMFDVGKTPEGFTSSHLEFQAGFRWNHHVYCDKK